MTARFAGSRDLDQRRRRRLAQEAAPVVPLSRRAPSARSLAEKSSAVAEDLQVPRFNPDESLIPSSPWKIASLSLTGLLAWVVMVWIGSDPGWRESALWDVVSLESGRLARFFSTVALLIASQLATLTLWYRSKSRKDFAGRYRIWAWASIYWSVLCLGTATGFHHPIVQILYEYWQVECWHPEITYWLAPAVAGFAALYTLLGTEIRRSPAGIILWRMCGVVGVAAAVAIVGGDLLLPRAWIPLATAGTATLWHYLAAVVFLVHARFVVHINNEAAPKRGRRERGLVAWYLQQIARLLMVRWPRLPRRRKQAISETLEDDASTPKKKPRRRRATRVATKQPIVDEPAETSTQVAEQQALEDHAVDEQESAARPPVVVTAPSQPLAPPIPVKKKLRVDPPQATPAPKSVMIPPPAPSAAAAPAAMLRQEQVDDYAGHDDYTDEDPDQEDGVDLSHLSRKERRKLRKMKKSQRN